MMAGKIVRNVIDKYILAHPESGIPLADIEIDNEFVKNFLGIMTMLQIL